MFLIIVSAGLPLLSLSWHVFVQTTHLIGQNKGALGPLMTSTSLNIYFVFFRKEKDRAKAKEKKKKDPSQLKEREV